ncbi:hypothetical protein FBBAL38_09877 [Flavobacteria bacterium BAL38]|uniref:hypothetical protein n=1 Tax=Flavobacterium sp. TaxID=239 RepID=UPI0000F38A45|nr:hypothetical protein FBBAL38_09877 [Flavobacteria bacterium BAL38]
MKAKENWIDEILNSSSGITKVSPNDTLLNKIQSKIKENKPADNFTKWLVAASIVVLVTLNTTILSQKRNENKNNTGIAEIVKTVNNQLY